MGSKKRAFFLCAALLLVANAAVAAPPGPQERETARRLMDEGKSRTKSGELSRALEAYSKAHEIMHVPTTGIALARTQYQLGHLVEARDVAREVLRYPQEPGEPAVFETARKQARELDALLKGRIPTVKIHVRGEPAKRVTVDDVEIPVVALGEPVAMNPGSRIITAYSADGAEAKTQLALSEKDAKEIELELLPGKSKGDPNASTTAKPGTKVQGFGLESDDPAGERTTTANVLVFGGFGLGIVGLVAGGVTGALAFSKADAVKPQCEKGICDPAAANDLDSAKSMATISNISFAVAGAGAVLGIVGLALPRSRGAHAASSTGVFVGLGGAGVRGSF